MACFDGTRCERLRISTWTGFDIRTGSLNQKAGTLSGGNQQKVILARNLATDPQVLLLHEPTRGIDVGTKADIYQILNGMAGGGIGVLIISSELPELISQCDRIRNLTPWPNLSGIRNERVPRRTNPGCRHGSNPVMALANT